MLSFPTQVKTERTGQHAMRLRRTYGRRIQFLVVGILLVLVFTVGSAPDRGTDASPSIMTYVIGAVTLLCFVVAAYDKQVLFNRETDELLVQDSLAFVPVRTAERELSAVHSVMLTHFPLSNKKKVKQRSLASDSPTEMVERPKEFLKLYLETSDERILLEGSSSRTELENMGRTIAEFLQINFKTQRI
jgi:hypothetical protein